MKDLQGNDLPRERSIIKRMTKPNGDIATIETDGQGNYGVYLNDALIRNHRKVKLGDMALDSAKGHFINLTDRIKM